jgi:hypothetical protein
VERSIRWQIGKVLDKTLRLLVFALVVMQKPLSTTTLAIDA